MAVRLINTCITAFWTLLILILLTVAIYVSLGRQFAPLIAEYRDLLEVRLEDILDADIELQGVQGTWVRFRPGIQIDTLMIEIPSDDIPEEDTEPALVVGSALAELDVWGSIKKRTWVFTGLSFSDVSLTLVETEPGKWKVKGLPDRKSSSNWKKMVNRMLVQHDLQLENIHLILDGLHSQKVLTVASFNLDNKGLSHYLHAKLVLGGEHYKRGDVIELVLSGEGDKVDNLSLRGYLSLPKTQWHHWGIVRKQLSDFSISRLNAGVQAWFDIEAMTVKNLDADIDVGQLSIKNHSVDERVPVISLQDAQFKLHVSRQDVRQYSAQVRDLTFQYDGLVLPETQIDGNWGFDQESGEHNVTLVANQLSVQPFVRLVADSRKLSEKMSRRLQGIDPRGILNKPVAQVQWIAGEPLKESLKTRLESQVSQAAIDASDGIPFVSGLNGHVVASHLYGKATWKNQDVQFGLPRLFRENWDLTAASGALEWVINPERFIIASPIVSGKADGAMVSGEFRLNLNRNQYNRDDLYLSLGITGGDVAKANKYVPAKNLDEALVQWLDNSIKGGQLKKGSMIYRGKIGKKKAMSVARTSSPETKSLLKNRVMQLQLDVAKGELDYLPPWPAVKQLEGTLFLDGGDVNAVVERGKLWNASASDVDVSVKSGVVSVKGQLSTQADEVIRFFTESPLKEQLAPVVGSWQATGKTYGSIALEVPLSAPENLTIDVSAQLDDGRLFMPEQALTFNHVEGQLAYNTEKGFEAPDLNAVLWRQPLKAHIKEVDKDGPKAAIKVEAQGPIDPDMAAQWSQQPVINVVEGIPHVDATLKFFVSAEKPKKLKNYLRLRSSLEGAVVNLPSPYFKKKEDKRDIDVKLTLNDGEKRLNVAYGQDLKAVLALRPAGIHRGQVYLGTSKAVMPTTQGVSVLGSTTEINYDHWMELVDRLVVEYAEHQQPGEKVATIEETLKHVDIHTDRYTMFGQQLGNLEAVVDRKKDHWDIFGKSNKIKGQVKIFDNVNVPMEVNLDYVHLPDDPQPENPAKNIGSKAVKPIVVDPLAEVKASDIPAMDVTLKEFFIGPEDFGSWSFQFRPDDKGGTFYDVDARLKSMRAKAEIRWDTIKEGKHLTQMTGVIEADNMAHVLRDWSMDPSLESSDSKFDVDVSWFASPAAVSLEKLNGDVSLHIKEGRFVESPNTGALKVFGILNFYSISRRLKLDFSDLYQKGLSYDNINGRLKLNEGIISLSEALVIKGPSGKFQVSGETNMHDQSLDLEMAVTFPISSSLPFIAVLAGLTPQIAGTIFVTEKLIGNELERFTSASYNITGTWDEPEMAINKRFNKDIEGSNNAQSLRARILSIFGIEVDENHDYDANSDEEFEGDDFDDYEYYD